MLFPTRHDRRITTSTPKPLVPIHHLGLYPQPPYPKRPVVRFGYRSHHQPERPGQQRPPKACQQGYACHGDEHEYERNCRYAMHRSDAGRAFE